MISQEAAFFGDYSIPIHLIPLSLRDTGLKIIEFGKCLLTLNAIKRALGIKSYFFSKLLTQQGLPNTVFNPDN